MNESNSLEILAGLLDERNRFPRRAARIDARIRTLFEEPWCIVFTDMVGFSRRAADEGIIVCLAAIDRMQRIVMDASEPEAGFAIKRIADSLILLFRNVDSAVRACVGMQRGLARDRARRPEHDRIHLGCGIGFGRVLKLGDADVFGVEVNYAAKLGEDIAHGGQILMTPAAVAKLTVEAVRARSVARSQITRGGPGYFELDYTLDAKPGARPSRGARKRKVPSARRVAAKPRAARR